MRGLYWQVKNVLAAIEKYIPRCRVFAAKRKLMRRKKERLLKDLSQVPIFLSMGVRIKAIR